MYSSNADSLFLFSAHCRDKTLKRRYVLSAVTLIFLSFLNLISFLHAFYICLEVEHMDTYKDPSAVISYLSVGDKRYIKNK